MDGIAAWGRQFLDAHGQLALFVVLLLEESGIPMPLPGDLVMLFAGVRVREGQLALLTALLLMEAGTLLGATFLYLVARRGGRPVLYRYGRFLHLDLDKLDKAEDFLRRYGLLAIVLGRLVPGLRIPTTLAAGVFGVPYPVFLLALALGASGYILVFFLLGYFVGPQVEAVLGAPHFPLRLVGIVIGLGAVVAAFWTIRRRAHLRSAVEGVREEVRLESALMAGLLATAAAALVIDLSLYAAATLGHQRPVEALLALGHLLGQRGAGRPWLVLSLGVGLYVVVQLAWAVAYAHVERWLPKPDWLGGLVFALVPLALSLLVVLPAVGAGVAGLGLAMGLVPAAGEALRHLVFGVALSTSYTLLTQARAAASGSVTV
jgi:membrane protein DedA with SNARE-associated domain